MITISLHPATIANILFIILIINSIKFLDLSKLINDSFGYCFTAVMIAAALAFTILGHVKC